MVTSGGTPTMISCSSWFQDPVLTIPHSWAPRLKWDFSHNRDVVSKVQICEHFLTRLTPTKPRWTEWLVIQSIGSKNKSGETAQPRRTPADIENQSETWPSTLTQRTVLVYRSSRRSINFWGTPLVLSSSQRDYLLTESNAARKSTYATHVGLLNSRLVCRIILNVAMRSVVDRWGANPLCSLRRSCCMEMAPDPWEDNTCIDLAWNG